MPTLYNKTVAGIDYKANSEESKATAEKLAWLIHKLIYWEFETVSMHSVEVIHLENNHQYIVQVNSQTKPTLSKIEYFVYGALACAHFTGLDIPNNTSNK